MRLCLGGGGWKKEQRDKWGLKILSTLQRRKLWKTQWGQSKGGLGKRVQELHKHGGQAMSRSHDRNTAWEGSKVKQAARLWRLPLWLGIVLPHSKAWAWFPEQEGKRVTLLEVLQQTSSSIHTNNSAEIALLPSLEKRKLSHRAWLWSQDDRVQFLTHVWLQCS